MLTLIRLLIPACSFLIPVLAFAAETESQRIDFLRCMLSDCGLEQNRLAKIGADVDPRFSLTHKCGTPFTIEAAAFQREFGTAAGFDDVLARPRPEDFPRTFDSPGGNFRIHFTTQAGDIDTVKSTDLDADGTPDYVEDVARVADSVWMHHIDELGYHAPYNDALPPYNDSDPRYDIYIRRTLPTFYGATYPESQVVVEGGRYRTASYMEVDNNYAVIPAYANRPLDALRVTIAHEFFHAIQFYYDALEGCQAVNRCDREEFNPYWLEMSAVWMEEETYDNVNDYYYYLAPYLRSLNKQPRYFDGSDIEVYGAGIYPIYLAQRLGRDVIRKIWDNCAAVATENYQFGAVQDAIDAHTNGATNFAESWIEFGQWLFFTGNRARPGLFFEEAANYDMIPDTLPGATRAFVRRYDDYPITLQQSGDNAYPISELGFNYMVFATGTLDTAFAMFFRGSTSTPVPTEWAIGTIGYDRFNPSGVTRVGDPVYTEDSALVRVEDLTAITDNLTLVTIVNPERNGSSVNYRFSVSDTSISVNENVIRFQNTRFMMSEVDTKPFRVEITLKNAGDYEIMIFNVAGEEVRTMAKENLPAATPFTVPWDGRNNDNDDVASGVYIVRVRLAEGVAEHKILLIR